MRCLCKAHNLQIWGLPSKRQFAASSMSYKMLQHSVMLQQQRKHAWIDRKKKHKHEQGAANSGKNVGTGNRFHKPANYRQHDTSKVSYSDLTCNSITMRGTVGSTKTSRKNALTQSQFLPPIPVDGRLTPVSRQSGIVYVEGGRRGPGGLEGLRPDTASKDQEKENLVSDHHKAASSPRSASGCGVVRNCWKHKTLACEGLDNHPKAPVKKTQSPDIYKSCLLVISKKEEKKKGSNTSRTLRATIMGNSVQRSLAQDNKVPHISSLRGCHGRTKAQEKMSLGDSAFGTDTSSDTGEVDSKLGDCKMELDHYTLQRVLDWVTQVNAVLFSPQTAETLPCPLTEQDTSIKVVYEGD